MLGALKQQCLGQQQCHTCPIVHAPRAACSGCSSRRVRHAALQDIEGTLWSFCQTSCRLPACRRAQVPGQRRHPQLAAARGRVLRRRRMASSTDASPAAAAPLKHHCVPSPGRALHSGPTRRGAEPCLRGGGCSRVAVPRLCAPLLISLSSAPLPVRCCVSFLPAPAPPPLPACFLLDARNAPRPPEACNLCTNHIV